jgi:hypothetical protein
VLVGAHCWFTSGQYDWSTKAFWGFPPFPYSLSSSRAKSPPEIMNPFWQTLIFDCTNWQIHSIPRVVNNTTLLEAWSMGTNDGWSIPSGLVIVVLGFCSRIPTFYVYKKIKRLLDECLSKR